MDKINRNIQYLENKTLNQSEVLYLISKQHQQKE